MPCKTINIKYWEYRRNIHYLELAKKILKMTQIGQSLKDNTRAYMHVYIFVYITFLMVKNYENAVDSWYLQIDGFYSWGKSANAQVNRIQLYMVETITQLKMGNLLEWIFH
jgi:hypothetical protein